MRPGETRLEEMIGAAFDRRAEPDATRLKMLEERLGRLATRTTTSRRPVSMYWWLLLVLAATGAAAWWSETLWRAPSGVEKAAVETAPTNREEIAPPTKAQGHNGVQVEQGRSPMIYRRERP